MKRTKVKLRACFWAPYLKSRIGNAGESGTSLYLLLARALEADGRPIPDGVTTKDWVLQNVAFIQDEATVLAKMVVESPTSGSKKGKAKQLAKKAERQAAKALNISAKLLPKGTAGRKPRRPRCELVEVRGISVTSDAFLETYEWRRLRMQAIKKFGRRCLCCGATPENGAVINVDHVKPRKLFPELALDINNLQVLCHECNHGKGNWDMTDWRPVEPQPEDMVQLDASDIAHLKSILMESTC